MASINGLNDFLNSPLADGLLLTKGLALFVLFLLAVRYLPDFARNLTLLLTSVALIEVATSPFYTFGFVGFTGLLYYGLFWLQWSPRKRIWCRVIALTMAASYFLLLAWRALDSPWTGAHVHDFGIAYALFRLLSVILDVGAGRPLPSDPLEFFVYAFFLPTFFKGPIERLDEFRQNLVGRPVLDWGETGSNLIRIGLALVKGLAAFRFFTIDWQTFFEHPQTLSYPALLWGMYARAISFYILASAYNDLTIGGCALAGYRISENYDYPYFQRNLAEFWRRWHMTLVRFLKDYVYIPLGGNRNHVYRNTLIVFLAIALWHRVTPAFVFWGLWHGLGMCALRGWQNFWKGVEGRTEPSFFGTLQDWARRYPAAVRIASTLFTFHFVALGWLPFWGGCPQGVSVLLRIVSGNRWWIQPW
jgi:D-alanyl-lipoteichoic acid acyltransferase DltB (MBOAT superfamily)